MNACSFQALLKLILSGLLAMFLVSCVSPTSLPADTSNPTSLSGIVFLTDPAQNGGWLLVARVELLKGNEIKVADYPDENRPQMFIFENIEPGTYQLWVLIPPDTLSLKNCYDVGLPDKTWKLGKIVDNDRIYAAPDKSYRELFLQAMADHPSDSKTLEFYAVTKTIDVKSGIDNYVDATFICKDR